MLNYYVSLSTMLLESILPAFTAVSLDLLSHLFVVDSPEFCTIRNLFPTKSSFLADWGLTYVFPCCGCGLLYRYLSSVHMSFAQTSCYFQ